MEPEGQVHSDNTVAAEKQCLLSTTLKEDPPTETAEVEPLPVFEEQDNNRVELPYETSRTMAMETQPTFVDEVNHQRPCSLFLCETPSYGVSFARL